MKKILLKIYYIILGISNYFLEKIIILKNKIIFLFFTKPYVKTTDESLNVIVNEGCSISRFGDGEFNLMNGENILFQSYSRELSLRLREIVKSNHEKHEVFIPNIFKSVNWCTDKSRNYWTRYLNLNRYKIYKLLEMKKKYYDSLVTRLYIDYADKSKAGNRFETFKRLWKNKEVLIVEGEKSRLGVGNDLFHNTKSIKRILCPTMDAYAKYDQILAAVKKHGNSKLILIALGPTATVLAYDLAIAGYHAIDIGHIDIEYEWFLNKAIDKEPVKNKYVAEVPNGNKVREINNKNYESETILKIT